MHTADGYAASVLPAPKTRLDHAYMAVALNLLRLEAFLDRHTT